MFQPPTSFHKRHFRRIRRLMGVAGRKLQARVEQAENRPCVGVPTEEFFPGALETGLGRPEVLQQRLKVRGLCAGCPVQDECLAGALQRGERYGGWGGLAQPDYRQLLRLWQAENAGEVA
ncbi:WhiB family transcriptional regulator [Crossiella sp. S99.2]|uniref:WhiB family transcriptional regulator n=1 Tax=Crossiella sp. S99.2 TaxID=2936272 RepID=UPI00200001F7|nr:WhiB family transcriptional regulator [Crossiella sp. S99.2]MCK2238083.1 WhiB family transcriptional regulator [Crossiella sp. S99.2]